MSELFRFIPSIHELVNNPLLRNEQHEFAVRVAQSCVQKIRQGIRNNEILELNTDVICQRLTIEKKLWKHPKLRRVINATGIVIHTNLGRSPLHPQIFSALQKRMKGYSNLEIRLDSGKRGGRIDGIRERICPLIGAEDVLVVNNNAAATLLAISAAAAGGNVLVSRGELVEIGGSFRIPDIIETGGAILKEVGTTNRTRLRDYESNIDSDTKAIVRVHSSNFSIIGFTESPERKELALLSGTHNIPLIEDLGSGLLQGAPRIQDADRLEREESIARAISEGADLVTFSGDKLLGGPQSGFIAGKKAWIEKCAKHPLYRALRLGKLSLLALEEVLQLYIEGRQHELPVWRALQRDPQECRKDAEYIVKHIHRGEVIPMLAYSGGGALPNQAIDSFGVYISHRSCQYVATWLRKATPAVLVRIHNDGVCIDTRTLLDGEREELVVLLNEVFSALD